MFEGFRQAAVSEFMALAGRAGLAPSKGSSAPGAQDRLLIANARAAPEPLSAVVVDTATDVYAYAGGHLAGADHCPRRQLGGTLNGLFIHAARAIAV